MTRHRSMITRCSRLLLASAACMLCISLSSAQKRINTTDLEALVKDKKATVGVAVLYGNDTLLLNNEVRYPLMSVFKFHVAVAAMKKMEISRIRLDSIIRIERSRLHENTYSPLRDKYPDGDVRLSYGELIKYAVAYSDNNACDILIDFVGDIGRVDSCIRALGVSGFHLSETEDSMHADIANSYNNWSTPLSMAEFLRKVYTEPVLNEEYFGFLKQTMSETTTGNDKLKAGIPSHLQLCHKTGHSDRTDDGIRIAENDAGVVILPNGEQCYIVVFVKDSAESDDTNARIIADMARTICEAIVMQQ